MIQHFQNKVSEIRGEKEFWGMMVWVPMNPSPQTKLRGGALVTQICNLTMFMVIA